jgi:hypothetical protein
MTEREMEDLIAEYPDDFFPDRGFKLSDRQQHFAGVGRFDLLFKDRFETNILMELKAVPAKYEVATQLAKYRDEMVSRGEKHILMWLVAPQIPASVREFLDRIGIQYTEIHEAEFRCVADRHGKALGALSAPQHRDLLREGMTNAPRKSAPQRTNEALREEKRTVPNGTCFTQLSESELSVGHREWLGNDKKDPYKYSGKVRLSESPLDVRLRWTNAPSGCEKMTPAFG